MISNTVRCNKLFTGYSANISFLPDRAAEKFIDYLFAGSYKKTREAAQMSHELTLVEKYFLLQKTIEASNLQE